MKTFDNKNTIIKEISLLTTNLKKVDNRIHTLAFSIVKHVDQHKEVSLINKLMQSMPKTGIKTNALKAYFETVSRGAWDNDAKVFKFDKTKQSDLKRAEKQPWHEFKAETERKAFDFGGELSRLLNKMIKACENGEMSLQVIVEFIKTNSISVTEKQMAQLEALNKAQAK
jgi:hypothetical protein